MRWLLLLLLVAPRTAQAGGVVQLDGGPAYWHLGSDEHRSDLGGARLGFGAGYQARRWALIGTASLSAGGGSDSASAATSHDQPRLLQFHVGARLALRLGAWVRLGLGPELGVLFARYWNPSVDGGEWVDTLSFEVGGVGEVVVDVLHREHGALYVSLGGGALSVVGHATSEAFAVLAVGYRFGR